MSIHLIWVVSFGTSNNSQLFFCSTDLDLTGRSELGGLIGYATDTEIHDSYSLGRITGISTGYKWDYSASGGYTGSYIDYSVTNYASQNVGGLVGQSKSTKITSSFFVGSVQYVEEEGASYESSGFNEYDGNYTETITGNYDPSGPGWVDPYYMYGGLVGNADNESNASSSFSNIDQLGSYTYSGTLDNYVEESGLRSQSTYTDAGWDFDKIWHISDGDYPILKWRQSSNNPPTDLNSTTVLAFSENQPVGTIVGEFNATDPEGGAVTYHFVNGENNNSLFTLDTNGVLKTATTFDYENNASSYTITIKAKDELNASIEGNFTVTLENVNEPSSGSVSISGTARVGETLSATDSLSDPDGMSGLTYQWFGMVSPSSQVAPSRME